MTPSQRIKFIRQKWDLDIKSMGQILGVEKRTIENYEKGTRQPDNKIWTLILVIEILKNEYGTTPKMILERLGRSENSDL